MALFFLTVALEIRREMTEGQLASLRGVAAPALAALGGMVVPALIYTGLNWHDPATLHGWAVPVATDIAFALAALAVLGRHVPVGLKVFLTALAILDDLGAIVVIAVFYSTTLHAVALIGGMATLAALYGLNRAGIRALSPYILGGAVLWVCLLYGGIHPTLAGVGLAFVVPMGDRASDGAASPAHRLETGLGGWVTWAVLPLFGLANAGLRLGGITPADFTTPLMLGTMLGLVVGKQIGVFGATLLAVRLRLAHLPPAVTRLHLYGGALLCGIGFTMSLFIGDLSFHSTPQHAEAKLAIFVGSLVSAALGLLVLMLARRPERAPARGPAHRLEHT
jgi:NhaA family Na+:H+ antiporter